MAFVIWAGSRGNSPGEARCAMQAFLHDRTMVEAKADQNVIELVSPDQREPASRAHEC
jgi:hypothetical protein